MKIIYTLLAISMSLFMNAQTYTPGNFSGSLDIGVMGSATYNIPIDMPAGIGNFQPKLSIVYSSQSGDGIMGKGFSISGISSISRRQSTLFHEGYINPVAYSSSDNYILDGNILKSYGTNEFRTESNIASRIKVISPNTSTAYFTIDGKDGLIYEYGNTIDSRLYTQGNENKQVAVWMLNKVTDRVGKYYTYSYEKDDTNGEIRIKQVDYTGSSSSSTFYSVKFNYGNRSNDVNLNYISGNKFKESKLLNSIQVYYGSTILRNYILQYEYFDYNYLLTQVGVTGQNSEILKPITFTWYKNSNFKQTQVKDDQSSYLTKSVITLGDFNSDGRTDFVATPMAGAGWTGWRLFLANADGDGFTYCSSGTIVDGLIRLIPGDFNGDGITDFIAHRNTSGGSNVVYSSKTGLSNDDRLNISEEFTWNLDSNGKIVKDSKIASDGSAITFMTINDSTVMRRRNSKAVVNENGLQVALAVSYDNYFVYYGTGSGFTYTAPAIITITRPHNIKIGDFNGDGAIDLFAYYTSKSGTLADYSILVSNYSSGSLTAFNSTYTGSLASSDNWGRVEVWDFNGDGLSEVMNLHDNGYNYFKSNGGNISKLRDSSFPGKKHKINFGDFNGDGKTDMLLTGYNNIEWSEWQTHLSTGLDFERFYFTKKFNTYSKEIFISDLNGDGMDDFFAVDNNVSSMTPVMYYLGYDCGKNFRNFTGVNVYSLDKWNFYPIDSRGDGRYGFITTSLPGSWSGYQLYMPPANFTNIVNIIKDAYGNETSITYKRMADATVYTKTNSSGGSPTVTGYDCLSFSAPHKLVSSIRSSDGIGGYRDITYKYENAKVFKRGRGILGCEKVIKTDVNNSLQTTIVQEFSPTYYQPAAKQIEEKKISTNRVLSLKNYINTLSQSSGIISFIPSSVSTKTYEPNNNNIVKSATTTYTYDFYNNTTGEVTTFGNGDKTELTNTYINDTTLWLIGLLTNKVVKNTIGGASKTNTVNYLYNTDGTLKTETFEPSNSAFTVLNSYQYDTYGNILKKNSTAGEQTRSEEFAYLSGRFPSKYTDVQGNVTNYEYAADWGLLSSEIRYGVKKTYIYDGFGRLRTSSVNTGETLSVDLFWTSGTPTNSVVRKEETFENGQTVKTWFDSFDREIQKEEKNFLGSAVTTKTAYNALGQITSISEPYFSSPQIFNNYTYDTYGRIITETTPLGNITNSYASTTSGTILTITDKTKGDSFTSTRTYDLSGKLKTIADSGGETITYTYGPSGNPSQIECGSAIYKMEYDILGKQTKLTDPNAGAINYTYNAWGNLYTKVDARNQSETYTYHTDGKLNTYKRGDETFTYQYYSDPDKPKDLIKMISNASGMKTEYIYDLYGRNTKVSETIETNKSFIFEYQYNNKNQIERITYPGSKVVKYEYSYGDLKKIIWDHSNTVVWEKLSDNAKGQLVSTRAGNGIQTNYQYIATGISTSIKSMNGITAILNLSYPSDQIDSRGNIKQRKDDYNVLSETFTYDNLNRLSTNVSYEANGNISNKVGVGTYSYSSTRPHAVSGLTNVPSSVMNDGLSVTYNSANRPLELSLNSTHKYMLTYGENGQRVKSIYIKPGETTKTKYYVGPYEEIVRGSSIQKNYYIYAGGEIVSVFTEGGSDLSAGLYYFHNDHLGSPWLITDSSKVEVQRLSYDAWGRRRDPNNWNSYSNLSAMKFDRGYTGQEHLDMFDLINMNARLYDPVLGRFLSVDPYVQAPDFSQAYNRYTYAMNNPLMYSDPDGEFAWFVIPIIAAAVGGTSNLIANWDHVDGFWQGFTSFTVGAGVGFSIAATAGSGASFWGLAGVSTACGVTTGATNSVVAQTGNNFSGFNMIDWGQVGTSGAIGGVAGFAGSAAGYWAMNSNWMINGVSHPLVKSAIVSPLAAGAGHVAGGTTAGVFQGKGLDAAFADSFNGIGQSMAIGGAIGVSTTAGMIYANGINPFTLNKIGGKVGVQYSRNLVEEAQKLYPQKAGKMELHHITPKYLGGKGNGPLVPLDASYHQVITNEFRALWPYGNGVPSASELQNIIMKVYSKYPIPPSH